MTNDAKKLAELKALRQSNPELARRVYQTYLTCVAAKRANARICL